MVLGRTHLVGKCVFEQFIVLLNDRATAPRISWVAVTQKHQFLSGIHRVFKLSDIALHACVVDPPRAKQPEHN